MKYVYLLQSISYPDQYYVGVTDNVKKRVQNHNSGGSKHTAKYRPWKPIVTIQFENKEKAKAFERYLKTGSGRAFAKRHFR